MDPAVRSLSPPPPEVVHEWRQMQGFNDPIVIQFFRFASGAIRGDFGTSFTRGVSVYAEVTSRLRFTLAIGFIALSLSLALALPISVLAEVKKNTWVDKLIRIITHIGASIPIVGLGLLLFSFYVYVTGWLPSSGHPRLFNEWSIIAGITLGIGMFSMMVRTVRYSSIGQNNQIHSKGLHKKKVIYKQTLRSALVSVFSALRTHFGAFISGIIIVENLFASPGIGRFLVQSTLSRDYSAILGAVVMFVFYCVAMNIFLDIAQALVDPRVREKSAYLLNIKQKRCIKNNTR